MRGILTFSMVALSAVLLAGDAQAQRGGGGFGGGRGGMGGGMGGGIHKVALLRLESVQDELGLDESQLEQIQAMRGGRGGRGGQAGGGERPNFRDMSEDERAEAMETMRLDAAQRQKEQEAKLTEILGADKMTRLNQIYIQAAGVGALQDPSVIEALDITEEQQSELREVSRDVMANFRETLQEGDREAMRERMTEMRAEVEKEAMAVLSDSQKEKLEEMKGAAFTMSDADRQALRGGGGRGGRGGDAGGGGRGGRGGEGGQRRGRPQSDE